MNNKLGGKIGRAFALAIAGFALPELVVAAFSDKLPPHQTTASGKANSVPQGYVPPLVSNGSVSMLVDCQGGQSQRAYSGMTPGIWWAGRRYAPGHNDMVPFGHFEQELSADGKGCTK